MSCFAPTRLLRGTGANIASLSVRILIQFAQVPILFSGWSAEQASAWLILWTLTSYMTLTVGAFDAAAGNIAMAAARRNDIDGVRSAYRAGCRAIRWSNLLMIVCCLTASPWISADARSHLGVSRTLEVAAALSLYIVILVQTSTLQLSFRYGEDYGGFALYDTGTSLVELAVTAAVVHLSGEMMLLPLSLAATRVASFAIVRAVARRKWPEVFVSVDPAFVRSTLRGMTMPFLGFIAVPLIFAVNLQGYSLLVSARFGSAAFVVFLTMRMLARMVDQLCNLVYTVLFNELSYLDLEGSRDAELATITIATLGLAIVAFVYIALILVVGPSFQALWTHGKVGFSYPLIVVFGIAGLIRAFSTPITAMLMVRNAHTRMTMIYLFASLAALLLAMVLASRGAPMTVIAGCVILAELSQFPVAYFGVARTLNLGPVDLARAAIHATRQTAAYAPRLFRTKPANS